MTGFERDYQPGLSEQEGFGALLTQVDAGIQWEDAGFLKVPVVVRAEINREIADHMHRLKRYLKLDAHPELRLLQEWNDIPPEDERTMGKIWGDAFLNKDIPQGRIRLSPGRIKERVTEKVNEVEPPVYPLGGTLAHEDFHIWQFINDSLAMEKDLQVIDGRNGWEEAWNCTGTEILAREFERYWIENWINH